MKAKFNIGREDLYRYDKPKNETTRRLIQLAELGMEEVGTAEFGIRGLISGIYIERVWHDNDQQWKEYVEWMKSVINKHNT